MRASLAVLWLMLSLAFQRAALGQSEALATVAERGGEYCETEVFRAACSDMEALLFTSARYGRMRLGRCVEFDLGYIDCYTDVLTRLDKRCSGRRTCEIRIPDAEFEATGPCLKELKTYLEVSYHCVPVERATPEFCAANSYINVTLPTGYINSAPTDAVSSSDAGNDVEPGCDHSAKPWVIAARRGQRVNLTLYDFALDNGHGTNRARTQESGRICRQYGWLDDSAFDRPAPLCATDRRVSLVYSSRGHVVKIWTMAPPTASADAATTTVEAKRFMIKYSVIGCADLESIPEQTWFERSSDGQSATMGCVNAEIKWSVRCVDNVWVGYHANCTVAHKHQKDESDFVDDTPIPYGLAIGIGALIGIFIALAIVTVVGCRRRDVTRGPLDVASSKRLQQHQLPLRQLDDYNCYATKMMPTYECPSCGTTDVTGSANDAHAGRKFQQTPGSACDICSPRPLVAYGDSRCLCSDERVWQSPYARLPVCETGSHVAYATQRPVRQPDTRTSSQGHSPVMTSLDDAEPAIEFPKGVFNNHGKARDVTGASQPPAPVSADAVLTIGESVMT